MGIRFIKIKHESIPFLLLLVVVFLSLFFHLSRIKDHYQDIDSEISIYALNHFSQISTQYNEYSYQGKWTTHHQWRLWCTSAFENLPMPEFLRGFYRLPYSTTYSPGMGLVYGLINKFSSDERQSVWNSIAFNIFLFHASVVLFFIFLGRIFRRDEVAILTSLIFLFSASNYSYAYNLGSPFWGIICSVLWLFLRFKNQNSMSSKSLSSALLFIFSYMIFIFWLAAVISDYLKERKIIPLLKKNSAFILTFAIVGALFFHPNQNHWINNPTISEFFPEIKYILLNFVSFFTSDEAQSFQLILVLTPFVLSTVWIKKSLKNNFSQRREFYLIFAVYFILSLFNLVPLQGTRHVLFLTSPFLVLFADAFVNSFDKVSKRKPSQVLGMAVLIAGIGFYALQLRSEEMRDKMLKIKVPENSEVILYESRFYFPSEASNVKLLLWGLKIGPQSIDDLEIEKKYIMVSQLQGLNRLLQDGFGKSEKFELEKLSLDSEDCDNKNFLAYERFHKDFQRNNCIFRSEFVLKKR